MRTTTTTTTTTVIESDNNIGRAAVLYTNRYGVVPALGRGGFNLRGLYGNPNGNAKTMYESGLVAVVVGETEYAYRVRLLNGDDKGSTVTISACWVVLV